MKKRILEALLSIIMLIIIININTFKSDAASSTPEEDFTYTVEDGVATITSYTGSDTEVTIPATIGGYSVYSLGDMKFSDMNDQPFFDNNNIEKVFIEEGINCIAPYTFWGCNKLGEVSIPTTLRFLGRGTFDCCIKLESVYLPKDCEIEWLNEGNLPFPANRTMFTVYSHTDSYAEKYIKEHINKGYNIRFVNLDIKPTASIELLKTEMTVKTGEFIAYSDVVKLYDKDGNDPNTNIDVWVRDLECKEDPYKLQSPVRSMITETADGFTITEPGTYTMKFACASNLVESEVIKIEVKDANEISEIILCVQEEGDTIVKEYKEGDTIVCERTPQYCPSYYWEIKYDKNSEFAKCEIVDEGDEDIFYISDYYGYLCGWYEGETEIVLREIGTGVEARYKIKIIDVGEESNNPDNSTADNDTNDNISDSTTDNTTGNDTNDNISDSTTDNDSINSDSYSTLEENEKEEEITAALNVANTVTMKKGKTVSVKVVKSSVPGDRIKDVKVVSGSKTVSAKLSGASLKIKAKKSGTAKVKVTTVAGAEKIIKIKVSDKKVKPAISIKSKVSVSKGKSYRLTYSLKKIPASGKVIFSSSNKKVATVGKTSGVIKGKKKGTAKITVKVDGKNVKTVKVSVK